MNTFIRKVTR